MNPSTNNHPLVGLEGANIVDLSHPFSSETIVWPTDEKCFKLEKEFYGMTPHGYFYSANHYSSPEHAGTHVDAPIHFSENGKTIDQIPLSQFMGPLVVIDVTMKVIEDQDYMVGVEDFKEYEKTHGKIPSGAIILLLTGFGKLWPDAKKYLGTDLRGEEALTKLRFPGLNPEGAIWLVNNTTIKGIGIDTASIDNGKSKLFESHQILCTNNILIFENVANLHLVPVTGAYVIALPMKIEGGTGAPVRFMVSWNK
jgi:kynurenine formamidase